MQRIEKQLEWLDYWEVVTRRRWILLAVLFVCGLAATAVAALWPVRYRSEALVLVEQQNVPSDYVRPNVSADARQRLATISQQVLSRTRLQNLIDRYRLYPSARPGGNKLVDRMRKDIALDPVKTDGSQHLTALKIAFTYGDPRTAQQVTNDLTSEFINQSLQARTQESAATTDFLTSELAQAQKDLATQQSQLSDLKTRYLGELPEQEQSNIQILSNLQAQLYAETNARDSAEQQEIYLQSLASAYRRMDKGRASTAGPAPGGPAPVAVIDKAISDLEQKLTALEAKYTLNYPDVVQARDQLAKWKAMRKAALLRGQTQQAATASSGPAAPPSSDPNLNEAQSRIKAAQAEIAMHNRQIDSLKRSIAATQNRLRLTPLREQQLASVTRSYQNARDNYESLLKKKLQSELATNLERREEGERLQVIDPASLPQRPVAPNRLEIVLGGWAVGLAAGIGLISAEEMTDDTLRSDFDIRQQIPCPVLAHVPILRSAAEERRSQWRRIAEIVGIVVLILASTGIGIFVCLVG
ncbi:MAG TPA: GNVR domain-containing protein [Candidatus Dormibacteraeota bacterium]|nr:GNVR domain-containing protein [Candidatus Dormibacteraeota bacterium]